MWCGTKTCSGSVVHVIYCTHRSLWRRSLRKNEGRSQQEQLPPMHIDHTVPSCRHAFVLDAPSMVSPVPFHGSKVATVAHGNHRLALTRRIISHTSPPSATSSCLPLHPRAPPNNNCVASPWLVEQQQRTERRHAYITNSPPHDLS
jgi:hypothetical protein